jgi:hypothetical protein
MNLLEHYIEEIYSEDSIHFGMVKVDMMTNCYGCFERVQKLYHPEEWERIKKRGYFMA